MPLCLRSVQAIGISIWASSQSSGNPDQGQIRLGCGITLAGLAIQVGTGRHAPRQAHTCSLQLQQTHLVVAQHCQCSPPALPHCGTCCVLLPLQLLFFVVFSIFAIKVHCHPK